MNAKTIFRFRICVVKKNYWPWRLNFTNAKTIFRFRICVVKKILAEEAQLHEHENDISFSHLCSEKRFAGRGGSTSRMRKRYFVSAFVQCKNLLAEKAEFHKHENDSSFLHLSSEKKPTGRGGSNSRYLVVSLPFGTKWRHLLAIELVLDLKVSNGTDGANQRNYRCQSAPTAPIGIDITNCRRQRQMAPTAIGAVRAAKLINFTNAKRYFAFAFMQKNKKVKVALSHELDKKNWRQLAQIYHQTAPNLYWFLYQWRRAFGGLGVIWRQLAPFTIQWR